MIIHEVLHKKNMKKSKLEVTTPKTFLRYDLFKRNPLPVVAKKRKKISTDDFEIPD